MGKIDVDLLRKEPLSNPTADEILKEFQSYIEYAEEREILITPLGWMNYLNISDTTYQRNWRKAGHNLGLNEEEFNERFRVLKKIDEAIEDLMTRDMLSTNYPTSRIFFLKAKYGWSDKADDSKQINISVGAVSPKKRKEDSKK